MKILHNNWLSKCLFYIGWFSLILLVLINCIYTLYLFPGTSDLLTDADIIQLPTMLLDLQENLSNFWGWKLPDAPYYFPDTVVFLLIGWLVQNVWWTIPIYSLVQACLLIFSLCWLYRELGGTVKLFLTLLLASILIFTGIYTASFSQLQGLITPYIYHLLSYIHFGTYVSCLFILSSSISYLRRPRKYLLILIVFVSLITTASDLIYAIYLTIPLIVAINCAKRVGLLKSDRVKQFSYILFFSSLVAYIFNKYFDSMAASTTVEIKLSKIWFSIKTIFNDLNNIDLREQFFLSLTIALPIVFIAVYSFHLFKNLRQVKTNNADELNFQLIVCWYTILGFIFNFLAVIILGKYTTIPHARYLLFMYYSPGFISLIIISLQLESANKHLNKIIMAAIAAIALITINSISQLKWQPITQILSPPEYVACFNLTQPQAGLTGYWQSKPLIAFSGRKLQIATIKPDGEPATWNSNRYWYTNSWQNPGNIPQFEFIFMKSLDENAIANRYGKPDRIEACNDSEIWWYNDLGSLSSIFQEDSRVHAANYAPLCDVVN